MYSTEELNEIRDAITGKIKLSNKEIEILKKEFENKKIPSYLYPFRVLSITNPKLYEKICKDEKVEKYFWFGFFPETFDLVYSSETPPEISLVQGSRGIIAIIKHPKKKVVIKPVGNSREPEIAQVAAELNVSPKQHKSLEGFLTEEFVEGYLFSRLPENKRSYDVMHSIGKRVGEILTNLHSKEIYYNDLILSDDFGRSHIIVPEKSPAILIDYSAALKLDNHPNLSDEEIYNFVKTLPSFFFLPWKPLEEVKRIIKEFREKLKKMTKEEILARDLYFMYTSLELSSFRLGKKIVEPLKKGFKEAYKQEKILETYLTLLKLQEAINFL